MQPEAVIIYERVLNGERWPYKYIGTITTKERTTEILRYLFFEKLGIRDEDLLAARGMVGRGLCLEARGKEPLASQQECQ